MHYFLLLRDIYERKLQLKEADKEQSNLFHKLKGKDKSVKPAEKIFLKIKQDYFLVQDKKFLIDEIPGFETTREPVQEPAPETAIEPALEPDQKPTQDPAPNKKTKSKVSSKN